MPLHTPEIVSLTPSVAVFTAPNPGPKTLSGTHTYVVGEERAYVIDPGPAIDEYQHSLVDWIHGHGLTIKGILLSHGHPDHAPGAATLRSRLDTSVWAADAMPLSQREQAEVDLTYEMDHEFPVDGDILAVLTSPGHSADHVAFWLQRSRTLFAGDTILGRGTTLVAPPDGNMSEYMRTLERMRALEPRLIMPGHGPIIDDAIGKIEEYLAHRRQREEQVLRAVQEGPATIDGLVRRIYTDVDPSLHGLAAGSVEAQLDKLVFEGRVRQAGGRYEINLA